MPVRSAGILLYRLGIRPVFPCSPQPVIPPPNEPEGLEIWIGHMGGPFWARRDSHAWSIPKGEYSQDEDPLAAALREFSEEMGTPAPAADYLHLGDFRQPSGKIITVYAGEHDFQPERINSNTFPLEWPKGSGKVQHYPEIDEARWFSAAEARIKLVKGQIPVLDALAEHLNRSPRNGPGDSGT